MAAMTADLSPASNLDHSGGFADVSAAHWPELSRLLDQALELPAPGRPAWLRALPAVTDEVRASLGRLLSVQRGVETGDFLDRLPLLLPATVPSAAGGPQSGELVGPWRLLHELGRGGMGSVWLAERDDGQLKRQVALKLPLMTWAPGLAERLRGERDILALLTHPHIARLYDAGVDGQGRPWLALEYVAGQAIDVFARERGIDVAARLRLLLQVCEAVAYAHSRLVIHRDLKPGNIMVSHDGQVQLLDFGIAKLLQGEHTEATALTRAGRALTPDYASPEHVRGEPLGTASDVYSLGVVAYELLTGQRPHRRKRGDLAELERAIASADAARASDAAGNPGLKKRLRGDLDAILHKALQRDPAQRYATAAALAEDIESHLAGHAVQARPDSGAYRLRRFAYRHRLVVGGVAFVIAALSVGLGTALWQTQQARENERQARQAIDREDAVKDLYVETLSTVAGWDAKTFAQTGSVSRLLQATLADFEQRYKDSPERRLGLLETTSVQLPFMGDYEGSLAVSKRYQALLRQTGADTSRQLRAALAVARALSNLARPEEAEVVLSEALKEWPASAERLRNRVLVQAELGHVVGLLGRRPAAATLLAEAEIDARAVPVASVRWNVQSKQARFYLGHDDTTALALVQRAHDAYTREPDAFEAEVGYSFHFLGQALMNLGRNAEAENELQQCVRRHDTMFGAVDRDSVAAFGRLAAAMGAQGRFAEARERLAERWVEVQARPGVDTVRASATLLARRLENEVAYGDAQAAGQVPPLAEAASRALASLPNIGIYVRSRTRALVWAGRAAPAAEQARLWWTAMPDYVQASPEGREVALAIAEAELAAGQASAASARIDALLQQMQRGSSTGTWHDREAQEWAALAQAAQGPAAAAWARLQAYEHSQGASGRVPPTQADRIDSALRRARLQRAAGRPDEAAETVASVRADLALQHPASPRRAAAAELEAGRQR